MIPQSSLSNLLCSVCYRKGPNQTSFLGLFSMMKKQRAFPSFALTRDQEQIHAPTFLGDTKDCNFCQMEYNLNLFYHHVRTQHKILHVYGFQAHKSMLNFSSQKAYMMNNKTYYFVQKTPKINTIGRWNHNSRKLKSSYTVKFYISTIPEVL